MEKVVKMIDANADKECERNKIMMNKLDDIANMRDPREKNAKN